MPGMTISTGLRAIDLALLLDGLFRKNTSAARLTGAQLLRSLIQATLRELAVVSTFQSGMLSTKSVKILIALWLI